MRSERMRGNVVLTNELPTYMIPEQYYGWPSTDRSDQYSLALLALEMLQGAPPVAVRNPVDLEPKRKFFDHPEQKFGLWEREAPWLADILRRMLRKNPSARWPSMFEIGKALRAGRHEWSRAADTRNRELAKRSYRQRFRGRREFYAAFYREFLQRSPESEALFDSSRMDRQFDMLDAAIEQVLNFLPGPEPTTMLRIVERHQRLGLTGKQIDNFFAAFLRTLELSGQVDNEACEAWRLTLEAGHAYMKEMLATIAPRDP